MVFVIASLLLCFTAVEMLNLVIKYKKVDGRPSKARLGFVLNHPIGISLLHPSWVSQITRTAGHTILQVTRIADHKGRL